MNAQKRKVWHITRSLYGGAGIYALRLNRALREAGVRSSVLCQDEQPDVKDEYPEANQLISAGGAVSQFANRVVRSLSHRLTSRPFHSLLGPETYQGSVMPEPGDIIHLHGLTGWMGMRGLSALIPKESPVFWTTHDLWPMSGGCILYSGCERYRDSCSGCPVLPTGLKYWATTELRMKAKFVTSKSVQPIANSRWMAERIEESRVFGGVQDIPVIPPIIDPAYQVTEIESIREELEVDPQKKVISLGARSVTDRFKGIPEFLDALAGRPEMAKEFTVLLIGDGELEPPDGIDVISLGRMNSADEIAQVYRASDVFVSPSAMETFGMALAEAQACGTPVVAFDVGGVRDAVAPECAEFIVENGDFEGLLNAVEKVVENSSPSSDRCHQNTYMAMEKFSASVVAEQQIEVYRNGGVELYN